MTNYLIHVILDMVGDKMDNIKILCNDKEYTYPKGINLFDLCKDFQKDFKHQIIIAKINGAPASLGEQVLQDSKVEFFDINSKFGSRAYERSAIFILSKAVKDVMNTTLKVEHSIDKGIYCKVKGINEEILSKVYTRMKEIVNADYRFERLTVNRLRVIDYYEKHGMQNNADILKYITHAYITIYKLVDMYDYLYGDMVYSTSYVSDFNLEYVGDDGFVIMLPFMYEDQKISTYTHHEHFFNAIMRFIDWTEKVGIRNFSEFNKKISDGFGDDLIFMNEANFNRNLLNAADTIARNKNIKLVLIAGPSCSGKTTTSKKLALFLKGRGLNPIALSTDDYFLERSETPVDENGNKDYERIEALDIDLFNSQLKDITDGKEVLAPTFNFITGKKEYNKKIKLPENGVLIIEGLHTLNDKLTSKISSENKFKIYISPLTALNVDDHTRLNSTDNRLLRRMVRDNLRRGYNASETLESWERVRAGETKYVFPYQDDADMILNTVLVYEMSILKIYAEPLLFSVPYNDPNYGEAIRLLGILKMILPMPSDSIPKDSVIREFIGGSCFDE